MHRGKGGWGVAARRLLSVRRARGQRSVISSRCSKNVAFRACTSRACAAHARTRNPGGMEMRLRLFRERDARLRVTRPILVAVLSISCAVAVAQQPPDRPDAGNILQQQREPLRLPPPPPDEIRPKPPEPRPALPVSPTLKVRVTQFKFSGNTLYTDEHLQEVVKEFVGKELDFEGLNDAATKVRAFHRERGYFLAQAYLPQQAIRGGVVEIAIIEGRVGEGAVQRRPASRLSEWVLAGILDAHLKTGDIITETGLERPLPLINDLPTAAVTSEIRPSQTIGAADLQIGRASCRERV